MRVTAAVASPEATASGAPVVAILLHGFGSDERDLVGLAPHLGLPFASLRAPVTLPHGGAAWFEITTPGNPAPEPVAEATEAIWAWIDENLPAAARLVALGFSQGGLMATQLLRTRPDRIAATVVLGGFVQAAAQPADEALRAARPAVFWGRGDADRVIHPAAVARTDAWLADHATADARVYPGLAHAIGGEELADAARHIREQIGVASAARP